MKLKTVLINQCVRSKSAVTDVVCVKFITSVVYSQRQLFWFIQCLWPCCSSMLLWRHNDYGLSAVYVHRFNSALVNRISLVHCCASLRSIVTVLKYCFVFHSFRKRSTKNTVLPIYGSVGNSYWCSGGQLFYSSSFPPAISTSHNSSFLVLNFPSHSLFPYTKRSKFFCCW